MDIGWCLFLDTYPCDPTATYEGKGSENCYQVTQTSVLAAPLASVLTSKEWHWNHETHGNHVKFLWKGVFSLVQPKPHFMCVVSLVCFQERTSTKHIMFPSLHLPISTISNIPPWWSRMTVSLFGWVLQQLQQTGKPQKWGIPNSIYLLDASGCWYSKRSSCISPKIYVSTPNGSRNSLVGWSRSRMQSEFELSKTSFPWLKSPTSSL